MATTTRARKAQLTKAAILESARREFAQHGFSGATVRAIAAGADIDPSMVIRYFGDKRTLFETATDLQITLPDLAALPVRKRGRALVEYFVGMWSGPAAEDRFRMLLFSATSDPAAAGRMREVLTGQILPMVRAAAGRDGAEIRAGLIASTMLGMALTRLVVAAPEVTALSGPDLVRFLAPTIDRYLAMPVVG